MFEYLIIVKPLGMLYGSAGAFLSPENLVGRSGAKFPPDAPTLSGLVFSANYSNEQRRKELKEKFYVAGPFWAENKTVKNFYVPIPRTKIIASEREFDEWQLKEKAEKDQTDFVWHREKVKQDIKSEFHWMRIDKWEKTTRVIAQTAKNNPWQYQPVLHPKMEKHERTVVSEDGLFLENCVQMPEEFSIVYLSTHSLEEGWYKLGGESHLVEINNLKIESSDYIHKLLNQPISRTFAIISPGVWGSNRLSYRYPQVSEFEGTKILTDKAIPYRYSSGGKLGRGRYAVPAGSVYRLEKPLNKTWWDWPETWFPKEGYSLKRFGSGLCLPIEIEIKGVN